MDDLFKKYMLRDYIAQYRKDLIQNIDKLEITETTDIESIINRLKDKFTINPIILKAPEPAAPRETTIARKDVFGDSFNQKVFEIDVIIPFEGDYNLFYCQASESFMVYLDRNTTINPKSVSTKIILDSLSKEKYFSSLNEVLATLKSNLPRIYQEISPWNTNLERLIRELLENRKGLVSQKHEFMEAIGLKINPSSNGFLIPPPVVKKVIPTPVSDTSRTIKKETIPILQEELYRDIKEVIYNVGRAIERKPSLFKDKEEEDLRDIFLLFLETRYESATGVGEAFNKKGRTDILLKYANDGTNVFVAECKFWRGQKKLQEAINQLLGYLTHRDSKTALIVFVDQKEFSSVVANMNSEIRNHPNFVSYKGQTFDHSFSYAFNLPDDSKKKIQIEIVLFHFPKN